MDHVESRPATPTALEVVLRSRPQQRARLVFALRMLLRLLWKAGEVLRRRVRMMIGVVVLLLLLLLLQVRFPQVDHALLTRHRKPTLELLLLTQEHPLLLELHLLDVVRRRGRGEDGAATAADAVEPSASLTASHLSSVGRPT